MSRILPDQYTLKDDLGFQAYRRVLCDMITSSDTPLAIGVFGRWGSGKTSLLKMLMADIDGLDLPSYRVAWFNAWKYDDQEALWRALILRVLDALRPRDDKGNLLPESDLAEWQKKMINDLDHLEESLYRTVEWKEIGQWMIDWAKAVPSTINTAAQLALSFAPGGKPLIDLLEMMYEGITGKDVPAISEAFQRKVREYRREQLRSIEQFEAQFGRMINEYVVAREGRLVVFVDDLDRCLPEKSVQVLEAIKLFMDVPGCVFVLALDKDVIERGIEVRYRHLGTNAQDESLPITGDNFLEKMIQMPFHLPPIDREDAVQFMRRLSTSFSRNAANVFSLGLLANPRKIKRAMNIFWMLKKIAKLRHTSGKLDISVNDTLLAKMIVIQTRGPDLYRELVEYPTLIQQLESYYRDRSTGEAIHQANLLVASGSAQDNDESSSQDIRKRANQKSEDVWDKYLLSREYSFLAKMLSWGERASDYFADLTVDQIEQYIYLTRSASESQEGVVYTGDEQALSILLSGDTIRIRDMMVRLIERSQGNIYRQVLQSHFTSKRDISKRFSAGIALGYLGEPENLEDFLSVPEGEFVFGSGENQQMRHTSAFRISKYPVTNSQYRAFIKAGGYSNKEYWSEKGWTIKEREGWKRPLFWSNPRLNQPNQPVVGVSWYEAMAYAKWAARRLPTEEEWERAARGTDGRTFPWGAEFDISKANTVESAIQSTSPVGMYPEGSSPCGALDMAGNVWEWTCQEHSLGGIVLRGGAWNDNSKYATCFHQFRDDPDKRFDNVGLRLSE